MIAIMHLRERSVIGCLGAMKHLIPSGSRTSTVNYSSLRSLITDTSSFLSVHLCAVCCTVPSVFPTKQTNFLVRVPLELNNISARFLDTAPSERLPRPPMKTSTIVFL